MAGPRATHGGAALGRRPRLGRGRDHLVAVGRALGQIEPTGAVTMARSSDPVAQPLVVAYRAFLPCHSYRRPTGATAPRTQIPRSSPLGRAGANGRRSPLRLRLGRTDSGAGDLGGPRAHFRAVRFALSRAASVSAVAQAFAPSPRLMATTPAGRGPTEFGIRRQLRELRAYLVLQMSHVCDVPQL